MQGMEPQPDTSNFVPAICAYHRAMATFRYADALQNAKTARDCAPCDSEAARWASTVAELEYRQMNGLQRLMASLKLGRAS